MSQNRPLGERGLPCRRGRNFLLHSNSIAAYRTPFFVYAATGNIRVVPCIESGSH